MEDEDRDEELLKQGHGRIGFGKNEGLFYYKDGVAYDWDRVYLVSSFFKKLYPNLINAIVKDSAPVNEVLEQIDIKEKYYSPGIFRQPNIEEFSEFDEEYYENDSKYGREYPGGISFSHMSEKESDLAIKRFLGYWIFDGIVVPYEARNAGKDEKGLLIVYKQEDMLTKVVAIQNEKLPLEEQLPCYSPNGKCIYNPLLLKK
ncbi:MAG: hypothetical protein ACD_7C00429G0005 [uncultured bacterium]|nr:MAG: hypothetical protein ACD_7C00429G0005 [uncultured bacterium]KKP68046.1 MAG: hypothetical protein UR66_C0009G0136 [Candidatus Moranbacteria bacterium GW2011_GWE1_35_17]KKP70480.1 MAG: hypothetical protein UR65_C0040G0003 [Candidatus Moranbacteria bacterium GW2011_GWE2_35_164]KKP81430.1 MAG: hypothetical protein UR82_C0064G0012 [Candidatus Moranbacteria bacterium GW2011_GWF1_35_5]KKP84964.1 MAG: hypothetical protein UR83_C0007G0010 [Candidatus Moranbacteria bacterium GW2011_GWF2_35_54]HB